MNGICGVVLHDTSKAVDSANCIPMLRAMGAQESNQDVTGPLLHVAFGVGFSPRRTAGIAQKIIHDRPVTLAFHGYLFNQDELCLRGGEGPKVLDNLLALYVKEGIEFLLRINGEFALTLSDGRNEALYIATDRFRIHPLFYYLNQHQLIFASRLAGVLACPLLEKPSLNPSSVIDVVSTSVIPTPRTIFHEVQKLAPGCVLTYRSGEIGTKSYWDVNFFEVDNRGEKALAKDLKVHFANAIHDRLNIDGNIERIGAFLSGGIDSSTIVGVLTQLAERPIKCFSIGFAEQPFNEADYSRCAAKAFGAEHFEYVVRAEEAFPVVPLVAESFDEPFGNASAIPTYFCAKLAREHGIDVLYGGDGGDELFAGNERYATQKIFDYYQCVPAIFRSSCLEPLIGSLSELTKNRFLTKAQKYIARANTPYPDRLLSWGLFEVMTMQEVFTKEFLAEAGSAYLSDSTVGALYKAAPANTELDRQLYIDLKLAISDNDVFKVTTMTNALGISVRFPFLDYRLVEFACRIPSHIKMRGSKLRTFFKNSYADVLPQEILEKSKHGFGLPIATWLRSDKKFKAMMKDLLLSSETIDRGYMSKAGIEELMSRHADDTTSFYGSIIWNIMMLEIWLRRHYDSLA